jgi:hypothetical protein
VKVIPGDIFDRIAAESAGPLGYEAGRDWIGNLGQTVDGGVVAFDYARFVSREFALLVFAAIGGLLFQRNSRWAASGIAWVGQRTWLLPLALYGVTALWRLVYVPCFWVDRAGINWKPADTPVKTLPVWRVGAEAWSWGDGVSLLQIRYGLVLYEEVVLLVCVAAWYGVAYVLLPKMRARISGLG